MAVSLFVVGLFPFKSLYATTRTAVASRSLNYNNNGLNKLSVSAAGNISSANQTGFSVVSFSVS